MAIVPLEYFVEDLGSLEGYLNPSFPSHDHEVRRDADSTESQKTV